MATTRWWKCDLQVATPAWDFAFPPGSNYDLRSADSAVRQAERIRFLNAYMARLKEQGVELIALADHNTGEWIDDAKAAGERNGVVVFPGCEITTQTGADGVHLLIIGDPSKTSQDFDRLIHGTLGFGQNNPPFHEIGGKKVNVRGHGSPGVGNSMKNLTLKVDVKDRSCQLLNGSRLDHFDRRDHVKRRGWPPLFSLFWR